MMLGWASVAAARISRRNSSRARPDLTTFADSTFSATTRPIVLCRALQTFAMPPGVGGCSALFRRCWRVFRSAAPLFSGRRYRLVTIGVPSRGTARVRLSIERVGRAFHPQGRRRRVLHERLDLGPIESGGFPRLD